MTIQMVQATNWQPDSELEEFECQTLHFGEDYDGKVVATLIRRQTPNPSQRAVLYLHGFMDYFFQKHLAQHYIEHGYNFYALDLRKYGRSLRDYHHRNFCFDISEYYEEITAAIRIIQDEGNDWLMLNGHSTGGLLAALYAANGEMGDQIQAMFLNSPFLDWNFKGFFHHVFKGFTALGHFFPYLAHRPSQKLPYIQSIHEAYHGEWAFNLNWRPLRDFPIYAGWCGAMTQAHLRVQEGLDLEIPILVMHSDKSIYGSEYAPKFQQGDAVLDVDLIKERSLNLGANIKIIEIEDGLHDIILSREDVRQHAFDELFTWLDTIDN